MATSGTTSFNLSIDEIVEEAYERIGIRINSGYDIKSARRSLNILFSEWGNRGVHLWKVELDQVALVQGQANYTVNTDVSDVLEAYISSTSGTPGTTTNDLSLSKIDRSTYAALPNKGTQGQPSQYYVIKRIEDSGAYTNTADVAYRFIPCMCAGLAYYLAIKRSPQRAELLKLAYEDEMKRALDEDGSRTSLYISPQSYFPNV